MKKETWDNVGFVLSMIMAFCMGSAVTRSGTDWSWRRQIAGHHAAEFYLDGRNYRQWRWIDCNPISVPKSNDSTTVNP